MLNTFFDLGNTYYILGDKGKSTGNFSYAYNNVADAVHQYSGSDVYRIRLESAITFLVCVVLLAAMGVFGVAVESVTVAPELLGYVSTVARNSRHLQLAKSKLSSAVSGGERARVLGGTMVMMQDVKPKANLGRIALGLKCDGAEKLKTARVYK